MLFIPTDTYITFAKNLIRLTRYFLHLAYDGTKYSGWQVQPKVNTVQETIEKALRIFVPDLKCIIGCGRTDTGVHASDYFAHFDTKANIPDELVYKLNAVLPLDIAILDCFPVDGRLHARFSARERTYKYHVHFSKNPFRNYYSAFHVNRLDLDLMNEASEYLLGEQDFSSFSKSQTQTHTNLCNVTFAQWEQIEDGAVFTISANRFLRNMVRAIVGTAFKVGEGKLAPKEIKTIIAEKQRSSAGKSAHPQGLFLNKIYYPELDGTDYR